MIQELFIMSSKTTEDKEPKHFLRFTEYIDQISIYFPHILLAILGLAVAFSLGA